MFKTKDIIKAKEALSISKKNNSNNVEKCIDIIDDYIIKVAHNGYCYLDIYYNNFGSLSIAAENNIDQIESILRDAGYEVSDIVYSSMVTSGKRIGIKISWENIEEDKQNV